MRKLLGVAGIDVILLDNFSNEQLVDAVALRDGVVLRETESSAGGVKLEASGGITQATVREIAMSGVDRISIGALTHSARAVDLSLERISLERISLERIP